MLSTIQRKTLYVAVIAVNGVLQGLTQANLLPQAWAGGVAILSLALTAAMKQFGSPDAIETTDKESAQ